MFSFLGRKSDAKLVYFFDPTKFLNAFFEEKELEFLYGIFLFGTHKKKATRNTASRSYKGLFVINELVHPGG